MDTTKASNCQISDQTTLPLIERPTIQERACPNCHKEADKPIENTGQDENRATREVEKKSADYEEPHLDAQKTGELIILEEDASEASEELLQNQGVFFEDTSTEAAYRHSEAQGDETTVEPTPAELKVEAPTGMPPMRKIISNDAAGTEANRASGSGTGDNPIVLDDDLQPTRPQSETMSIGGDGETSSCMSELPSISAFRNAKNKQSRLLQNATPSRKKRKRNIENMSQWTDPSYQEQLDSQVEENWTQVQIRWLKAKGLAKKAANGNPCLEAAVEQFEAEMDTAYHEAKDIRKVSSMRASSLHGSWILVEGRIRESGYVSAQEEYEVIYEYQKQIVKLNESLKQLAESTNARHALRLDPGSTGGDDENDGDYGKPKRHKPKVRPRR